MFETFNIRFSRHHIPNNYSDCNFFVSSSPSSKLTSNETSIRKKLIAAKIFVFFPHDFFPFVFLRRLCVAINVAVFATVQTIRSHTKSGVFFSSLCRCLLSFRLVFLAKHSTMPRREFSIKTIFASDFFLIRSKFFYSLVPLRFRPRNFPVGGVNKGLETVDEDETRFGVCCESVGADEVNKALMAPDLSSGEDGSTMTDADFLDAGVLVMIVEVVVIFEDVTKDGVD